MTITIVQRPLKYQGRKTAAIYLEIKTVGSKQVLNPFYIPHHIYHKLLSHFKIGHYQDIGTASSPDVAQYLSHYSTDSISRACSGYRHPKYHKNLQRPFFKNFSILKTKLAAGNLQKLVLVTGALSYAINVVQCGKKYRLLPPALIIILRFTKKCLSIYFLVWTCCYIDSLHVTLFCITAVLVQ